MHMPVRHVHKLANAGTRTEHCAQGAQTLHLGDGHVAQLPLEDLLGTQAVALARPHTPCSACTLGG
jgi:hypothetical protein